MHGDKADQTSIAQRQAALSRWDNEGGALSRSAIQTGAETPVLTNAELVLLRIRVIALENLVISLLAGGSDGQLDIARELASHISPRSGAKHHLLTVEAARHMMDLVKRAFNFRPASSS